MGKYCECKTWQDCRFKKTGVGFAICQGTAIMPDGSVISPERRQQYVDRWTKTPAARTSYTPQKKFASVCPYRGDEIRRESCPSCRGHVEVKVFSCSRNGECTISKSLDGCSVCTWRVDQSKPIVDPPVFVMAAPREGSMHVRTLASVFGAGFSRVTVSCEPGTYTNPLKSLFPVASIVQHRQRLGQWQHLIAVLRMALAAGRPYFLLVEDDVEVCRDAADLIARTAWPANDCGVVQLYAAESYKNKYPYGVRSRLRPENALDMLGACALLFRLDAAKVLVEWTATNVWRGDTGATIDEPTKKKAGDTFIGEILTQKGFSIWTHNPSIANHIGTEESTLGHQIFNSPNRRTLAFPGIDADLVKIFEGDLV